MIVFLGTLKPYKHGTETLQPAYHVARDCFYLQNSNPGGFGLIEFDADEARKRYRPCSKCVR